MGNYHPHGDAAIYDAMVRMAQDFAMRLPLIDGQGNYGSMDGDPRGGDALHRGAAVARRRRAARRHRQGNRRVPAELRRQPRRAGGSAGALSQSSGQRRQRHRRRHGDQHPDPQSGRGDRRDDRAHRQPRAHRRRADGACARPGFSHRRHHPRPQPAFMRPTASGAARSSCAARPRSSPWAATARPSSSPRCPTRSTRRA